MVLPRIMLVTDRRVCTDLIWAVERALQGGIRLVQLRERDLPSGELLELARGLRELTLKWDALLLVNDRVDIALLSGADGVHLGEAGLPVREARRLLPNGSLVTCAAHSVVTAVKAVQAGADAIIAGTIFETESKPGVQPAGLPFLEAIARAVKAPVFAIGGIDLQRAPLAVRAGAYGVAVIRAVLGQPDPFEAAVALQRAITSHIDKGGGLSMAVSDMHYTITVCGQPETVGPHETVQEYLTQKGVNPTRVVVEINRRILPREEYDKYCFQPGDEVEIVHFVGGGSL